MRPRKLTFEQTARMLFEYTPGVNSSAVARKYGMSPENLWLWRRYKGLDAHWLEYVKDLEHRVAIATRRSARLARHLSIATGLIKRFQPEAKRRVVLATALRAVHNLDRKNANLIVGLSKMTGDQASVVVDQNRLITLMREYLADHPSDGFQKMFKILLRDEPCSRNKALMLYEENGFSLLKRKRLPRHPVPAIKPMSIQVQPDMIWSMDFIVDALPNGQRFWVLSALDDFNREAMIVKAMPRNSTKAVTEALAEVTALGRTPRAIRTDNGGEFRSASYYAWMERRKIRRILSSPGKPTENAYIERFNGTLRREIVNRFEFRSLKQVQECLDTWRERYNLARPQKNLGWLSPVQYAHIHAKA